MPQNDTEYTVLRTLLEMGSPFLRDSPEPLEGEAVCRAKAVPPGIAQTLSIGPALEIKHAAFCFTVELFTSLLAEAFSP